MPTWLLFALGTVCCWGAYGTAIHKSNSLLGEGLKPALLVGVALKGRRTPWPLDDSLRELAQLAATAGADVVGTVPKTRESPGGR